MKHFVAGYLLVEPIPCPTWTAKQPGPEILTTASGCLCFIHPGKWGIEGFP